VDQADGTVKFQLRNNVGTDIIVDNINASTETVEPYSCTESTAGLNNVWKDRTTKDFNFTKCNSTNAQFSKGKKGKILIYLTYYKVGAQAFKHTVTGEIYATVK
jgi:hypothetical protein